MPADAEAPRRPRRGRPPGSGAGRHGGADRAARWARRAASVPTLTYPEQLPVVARRDDIAAALREHQVVVVAGETGSGKTTQLPKICLELGRGVRGVIGHTQPRRIAARAVAERLAEELGVELGSIVGYQVRFTDRASPDTLVKVMTDGILLAELQRDRQLRRYDTVIIDEAHERSLNIDVLLGYLKQLLPRRPDLKLVLASATIDPQRFAEHFAVGGRPAPVIEVSGRTFPVQVRYRPLTRETPDGGLVDLDQVAGVVEAVEELWTEAGGGDGRGHDILVFLSGEREIRDTAEAVRALALPDTQVLPLYGRLSADEQHRVFAAHGGRRIVLATNVAETSLTVPGIRYVVDAGTARVSRYSQRTKVQRLPIEPVSQASAQQRSGRCGRVADGIAIRLYSQEDFESRAAFTEPEILRTSLASVILRMTDLGLGEVSAFPFLDPPDARRVTDGMRLLHELGAVEPDPAARDAAGRRRLTPRGRLLARLPVDPRMGAMLAAAQEAGALAEALVIVAALSIQDPRERPADQQAQADQAHARFKDERSDFITVLNLWRYLRQRQRELSGSGFRRMCRAEHLHYLRVREWQDLRGQLRSVAAELGWRENTVPASADTVHQSLLPGLLSHIGLRDRERRDYLGARGARFAIQPGSTLFRRPPDWVMAAELVETSRLWARVVAPIEPEWAERAGAHLVRRSHSEPRWSAKRGSAVAAERVTLYGVPLALDRVVPYARVDPAAARQLFIRHALVEGQWRTEHRFFHGNRALLDQLADVEHRARRRDILVDEEALVEFYDRRLPEDVVSAAHFDSWWKQARRADPGLLTFTPELLLVDEEALDEQAHPSAWRQGDLELPLSYQFQPGAESDGVTAHIPVAALNQVSDADLGWNVPGTRLDLVTALLRSLPKPIRRQLAPAPDTAAALLPQLRPDAGTITAELSRALAQSRGVQVRDADWDWSKVPSHLRLTYRVEGAAGHVVGEGKDLATLRAQAAPALRQTLSRAAPSLLRQGMVSWDCGDLPEVVRAEVGGGQVVGHPALVDHGESVAVEVLPTPAEAAHAMAAGVRRLVLLNVSAPWGRLVGELSNAEKLALSDNPHGSVPALLADCLCAAVDHLLTAQGPPPRSQAGFAAAVTAVRAGLQPACREVLGLVCVILRRAGDLRLALRGMRSPVTSDLREDLSAQLTHLAGHPGFVADAGLARLRRLPRYLQAMAARVERAPGRLDRDRELAAPARELTARTLAALAPLAAHDPRRGPLEDVLWQVEELRVSLFAQHLGVSAPVSPQRVARALAAATAERDGRP